MDLREQDFGLEIEMTGLTRRRARQVLAKYFDSFCEYEGTYYDAWFAKDRQGRKWKVMSDASIDCQTRQDGRRISADGSYSVELVTPICQYGDIEMIQEIVRALRDAGAFVNNSCGIHIHVNAAPFDAPHLRNLVNIMAAKEDMIYRALQVDRDREHDYCKKIEPDFLEKLNRQRPQTMDALKDLWYRGQDGSGTHYHYSRYHCLNLHSVFQKGTIEFRAFNSSLHAGKIKAYLQFCLAMTAQAFNQRSASPKKTVSSNEKYTFRVWLLRLGMIGKEFETARLHLLNHLDGNIAWKDPAQAERQKERMKARQALEQHEESQPQLETQHEPEAESAPGFSLSM